MARSLKRRSPLFPVLLSAFVAPGLGQILNRETIKGMFLFFSFFGSLMWFTRSVTERLSFLLPGQPEEWAKDQVAFMSAFIKIFNENPGMFYTFQLLLLVIWVFGIVDAYMGARNPKTPHRSVSNEANDTND